MKTRTWSGMAPDASTPATSIDREISWVRVTGCSSQSQISAAEPARTVGCPSFPVNPRATTRSSRSTHATSGCRWYLRLVGRRADPRRGVARPRAARRSRRRCLGLGVRRRAFVARAFVARGFVARGRFAVGGERSLGQLLERRPVRLPSRPPQRRSDAGDDMDGPPRLRIHREHRHTVGVLEGKLVAGCRPGEVGSFARGDRPRDGGFGGRSIRHHRNHRLTHDQSRDDLRADRPLRDR